MNYEPQDFTRCNGNPCFEYCEKCKRNLKNSPVHPEAMQVWFVGPWVIEDEKCPSFKEMKDDA